jgi:PPOX class probable F420-dependent enzyme
VNLTAAASRDRFADARVARMATADADGVPHLVPIVFAVWSEVGADRLYTAIDGKPKGRSPLRRLANIAANPRVAVLVDDYAEDWTQLWWARADGTARVLPLGEPEVVGALRLLAGRYPQYDQVPIIGPLIAVDVERWSGWQYGSTG